MRLRDLLLSTRIIDATVLARAEAHAEQAQLPLVRVLVGFKVVDGRVLARLLSRALHFEIIDVAAIDIHPRLLQVVPRHAAEALRVLPIGVKQGVTGGSLYLAMADPTNEDTITTVETATGLHVEPLVCDDDVLQACFEKHYGILGPDTPILVGDLVSQGNHEFLTELTAEALRHVHTARSAEVPVPAHLDGPTIELSLKQLLGSVVGGGAHTVDTTRGPSASQVLGDGSTTTRVSRRLRLPTVKTVASLSPLDEPTVVPSEDAFDEQTDKARRVPLSVHLPTGPIGRHHGVVVAASGIAPVFRAELRELIGPVEIFDDDVAACHAAVGHVALVLIEPRSRSPLLRALLDLEELVPRPRIVVLGGDPALRLLAFVDHHADAPIEKRATAIAVVAALRFAGVDV
jgi:hypothetical protein